MCWRNHWRWSRSGLNVPSPAKTRDRGAARRRRCAIAEGPDVGEIAAVAVAVSVVVWPSVVGLLLVSAALVMAVSRTVIVTLSAACGQGAAVGDEQAEGQRGRRGRRREGRLRGRAAAQRDGWAARLLPGIAQRVWPSGSLLPVPLSVTVEPTVTVWSFPRLDDGAWLETTIAFAETEPALLAAVTMAAGAHAGIGVVVDAAPPQPASRRQSSTGRRCWYRPSSRP